MTKYILHGGYTRIKNESNKMFFKEILLSFNKSVKILFIFFARPEKDWETLEKREKNHLKTARPDLQLDLIIASNDIISLEKQILESDVIYIIGGENKPLINKLKNIKNLKDLFKDKVVVGSSAGAYCLSTYYYSHEAKGIFDGLGILPIKTLAHYSPLLEKKLEELKVYKEKLDTYAIEETKYIVLEQ